MTSVARPATEESVTAPPTTQWFAWMLVGASLVELVILRTGTRIAIHIPDIQDVQGPYRLVAATGRLAFYTAVVALVVLLGRLALDLHEAARGHLAAAILGFGAVAALSAVGVAGDGLVAAVTVGVVLIFGAESLGRSSRLVGAAIALFAVAFALAATVSILHATQNSVSAGFVEQLTVRSEQLAVLAAIASGPLVRIGLGLSWAPGRRLAFSSGAAALFVTLAVMANPSTVHTLMLWNFGLTGALPAIFYGVAVGSLALAVGSALATGRQPLAAAIILLCLGGIGLISTYQSGLVIAGLACIRSMPLDPSTLTSYPLPSIGGARSVERGDCRDL